MQTFKGFLESQLPPGMENWAKENEASFIAKHGEQDYKPYMMSTAWTIYRRVYRDSGLDLQ